MLSPHSSSFNTICLNVRKQYNFPIIKFFGRKNKYFVDVNCNFWKNLWLRLWLRTICIPFVNFAWRKNGRETEASISTKCTGFVFNSILILAYSYLAIYIEVRWKKICLAHRFGKKGKICRNGQTFELKVSKDSHSFLRRFVRTRIEWKYAFSF